MCAHNSYAYIWLDGKLTPIDQCIVGLILQLNQAGIKTLDSCCGHGKIFPRVICAPGTKQKLNAFGCKCAIIRKDDKVDALFPVNNSGSTYAYEPD